jgi:hypothetical protein
MVDDPKRTAQLSRDGRSGGTGHPRVYLHVGEPKTGTTFLQDVLWANRAWLAANGIVLPGYSQLDHFRASKDLRQARREPGDPADPWIGEWDVLAGQALRAGSAALISEEVLTACTPAQASRAVRSLAPADVHVLVTVRDFGSVLPAEWQENIKCRGTVPWEEWLHAIMASESANRRRAQSWFWTMHGTLANLDMWSQHIAPDQVHVITMPRRGSADTLWSRFASVLGVDPEGANADLARSNSSLGPAEAEFLRRLNAALPEELPEWFYKRHVKQSVALDALSGLPDRPRLVLPPDVHEWAAHQAEILIAGLRDAKYHIVGDLDELRPLPTAGQYVAPEASPADELLTAAVLASSALAERHYLDTFVAKRKRRRLGGPRQATRMLVWGVLNGSRTKRLLRKSSHLRAARQLRIQIYRLLMHPARPNARHAPYQLFRIGDPARHEWRPRA